MPLTLLKQRGSRIARERKGEPAPPDASKPRCPMWLRPPAKRVWRRLCAALKDMLGEGFGQIDRNALARYCQVWAKYREAEEYIEANGTVIEVPVWSKGEVVGYDVRERPQARQADRWVEQLLRLEREFGLTPSARARLATRTTDPEENRGRSQFGDMQIHVGA